MPAQAIGEIVAPVKAPQVKAKAEAKTKAKAQPKPPAKKAKPAPKAMAQAKAVPALNTEKVDHATTAKVLLGLLTRPEGATVGEMLAATHFSSHEALVRFNTKVI